jgi:tetratricopeptide (TPR) repeat protein
MGSVGLPPKVVVPIVMVFAVVFLGIMGYFLRIGFATTGSAFGPQAQPHEQGDARIAATPVPESAPTDPPGTVDIPQSGTGPVADNPPVTSGDVSGGEPGPASGPNALPPGNPTGGGGPPAPVMQILSQLKARVARNPRDIGALVELGNLYFDASKFDQAVGYYKSALALDPTNPEVRNDEAAALHASGHDLDALREVDRVLAERPNFPQALFNRGIVLGSMGRRSDAVLAYREFLKVAPKDPHAADAQTAIKELAR